RDAAIHRDVAARCSARDHVPGDRAWFARPGVWILTGEHMFRSRSESRFQRILIACTALVFLASCDRGRRLGDPPQQEWRFALEEPVGSVQHAYALRFKELIESRSGGEIS